MSRTRIIASVALVFLARVSPVQAQWTPPIGVPMPSFGIAEVARAVPSPWNTPTAGSYYVDATHSASTDSSNPYGTPARPRKSIPDSLPAGAVVELHGTYDVQHTSPRNIIANGTAASPIFIRGVSATAKPIIRSPWELSGSYVILENLEFAPYDQSRTGQLAMLAPLHHAALRHSDLHGNLISGGLGVVSWSSALTQHVVVFNNSIHDNGNVNATYDQDVHGISVGQRVSYLWIVDNRLYRNSGDGIQLNGGSIATQPSLHHIYIGRNTTYNNKQTGIWSKQSVDVIVSQNRCYGHRPGNSSMGMCMGYQYSAERIWFLYNVISDSEFGIGVGSNNDLGMGVDSAMIGNIIYNIHHSGAGYDPNTAWGTAGIMLAGGTHVQIVNNTIWDVDAGINVPYNLASLEIADNIIGQVTVPAANHVYVEQPGLASRLSMHHNLFYGNPRARLAAYQAPISAAQLAASYSISAFPVFFDSVGGNFRLQSSSPAIDHGEVNPVYGSFQQRYGVSIALDPDRTSRPSGVTVDFGAFEYGSCGTGPQPPNAPTGLTATASGQTGTLRWTEPASCNMATNFVVEAGSSPGLTDLGIGRTSSNATSFTIPNVPWGTYYFRVKAENAAGVSPASNEAALVIGAPGPATLVAPAGTSSNGNPTFQWNAVPGTLSYYLWVNDSSAAPKHTQWISAAAAGCASGTGMCAFTPGVALRGGAVRWWIRTWNDAGLGAWSTPLDFTVPSITATTLLEPSGSIATSTPTYSWSAVAGATYYYLWVNSGASAPHITQWFSAAAAGCASGTGTCSATPGTAVLTGAGKWWIAAWNETEGYAPWSVPLEFVR